MKRLLLLLCWPSLAWASDYVHCDPADATVPNRVVQYERSANTQTAWLTDPTYLINPNPLPSGTWQHWKCQGQTVVMMTSAEQTAFNAPAVAEQVRQDTFTAQITGDDVCKGELATIDTQIDTAFSTASTASQIKTVAIAVLKRVARCIRARAR